VADTYLFTVLHWMITMKFNTAYYAHLIAWFNRIAARTAVIAVLNAKGLRWVVSGKYHSTCSGMFTNS
jgi:glutathione S-transferase